MDFLRRVGVYGIISIILAAAVTLLYKLTCFNSGSLGGWLGCNDLLVLLYFKLVTVHFVALVLVDLLLRQMTIVFSYPKEVNVRAPSMTVGIISFTTIVYFVLISMLESIDAPLPF